MPQGQQRKVVGEEPLIAFPSERAKQAPPGKAPRRVVSEEPMEKGPSVYERTMQGLVKPETVTAALSRIPADVSYGLLQGLSPEEMEQQEQQFISEGKP